MQPRSPRAPSVLTISYRQHIRPPISGRPYLSSDVTTYHNWRTRKNIHLLLLRGGRRRTKKANHPSLSLPVRKLSATLPAKPRIQKDSPATCLRIAAPPLAVSICAPLTMISSSFPNIPCRFPVYLLRARKQPRKSHFHIQGQARGHT